MRAFVNGREMYDGFSPLECCNVELVYAAIHDELGEEKIVLRGGKVL